MQRRAAYCKTENSYILTKKPPCRLFLKLQNRNIGGSFQLESTESKVIPARSHLIFAVRECLEQILRGDRIHRGRRLGFEWCVQKLVAPPSVLRVERPMCRWHLLSGESGFMREVVGESSTLGTDARTVTRECVWNRARQARASEQWISISSISCGAERPVECGSIRGRTVAA